MHPTHSFSSKPVKASAKTIEIGNARRITVFVNKTQAERLKEQIVLQRKGYRVFYDSEVNDKGFVALHDSWVRKVEFDTMGNIKGSFKVEFEVGKKLADLGYRIEFNYNVKNYRGGPVDFILNGKKFELKTPDSSKAISIYKSFARKKKGQVYQSDYYMINLLENLEQEEYLELRRKILSWLRAHPGKKVYLFLI